MTDDSGDPFGDVAYSAGVVLDLTASEAELETQLRGLIVREGRMDATGLTCDLKDRGQDCLRCQHGTLDAEDPRNRLCRLGKDQQMVVRAIEGRVRDRKAGLEELIALADEASEVGHLDAELAELLTEVGL